MRSSVNQYIPYQDLPVPRELLTIEIPSWDAVAQPMVDYVEEKYVETFGTPWSALTDEMVSALDIPGIKTLAQVKQYGMDVYKKNQEYYQYFEKVLPFILKYYHDNSNTIIDREEKEAYQEEYLAQVQAYAEEANLSLADYVQDTLHLSGEPKVALRRRASEDFTFKLIAWDVFNRRGNTLADEDYENYIQQNVLYHQADEIELREQMPKDSYFASLPEMQFSQEVFEFYLKQMTVKINPTAPVRLFRSH